jgi:hypothetical protein
MSESIRKLRSHIPATVILTDCIQAVLFTAWTQRNIDDELEEHFPDGARMYFCPRFNDEFLVEWPCYSEVSIRRHVVPFGAVEHIIKTAGVASRATVGEERERGNG